MQPVISGDALWNISAQFTPAATNRGLRKTINYHIPPPPFLFPLCAAISYDLVNLCLGFHPLEPWSLPVQKCSNNSLQMRAKS
jgi:hypothetical protein